MCRGDLHLQLLIAMMLGSGLCFTNESFAADVVGKQAIADYLETQWSANTANKTEAAAKFEALLAATKGDVRSHYAHVLVCIHQRRFEDATKATDELLAIDETHLPAWQAKIWLALLNKQYGVAIAAAEKLGALAAKAVATEQKEQAAEASRFLGMVFGFLEGPVGDSPAALMHQAAEKKVADLLAPEQLELFKGSRQSVMEKYIAFVNNKEESKEKALADEETEKQRKLEDVTRRRGEIVKEIEADRSRYKDLEAKYDRESAEITKADGPLASDQLRAETSANAVLQQLANAQGELASVERSIVSERDPRIRSLLQVNANRLNGIINRYNSDLFALQQTVQRLNGKRTELVIRKQKLDQDIGGQMKTMEKRLAGFTNEERRLDNIERQTRKPATGTSGKTTALGLTAKALNTYEPFPLEREKAKLLDSLR